MPCPDFLQGPMVTIESHNFEQLVSNGAVMSCSILNLLWGLVYNDNRVIVFHSKLEMYRFGIRSHSSLLERL